MPGSREAPQIWPQQAYIAVMFVQSSPCVESNGGAELTLGMVRRRLIGAKPAFGAKHDRKEKTL
jgi:hypothetical protein